ncbi:MAG: CYTH domain-containing protein [Oscillospiraceae bacterium]|nr:CYTH domain-containing protein [Oscillospiraceae bacterium]
MGRELELKYRADGETLAAIREKFGEFMPISMETVYYDTPDGVLRARHWTLRRRMENGVAVCTLKTPLPDGSRGEWETECGDILAAVPKLCKLGAPEELKALTAQGVRESCGAKFTRLAKLLDIGGCTVEIALDKGVLLGGGKETPLCEVEVEYKDGDESAAHILAQMLAAEFHMHREPKSKVVRAMELVQR